MPGPKPKLSVIICTFNRAESLRACLENLACQTRKDFEVVIVDAASTDQTPRVVADYSSKLKILKITETEKELAKARDKGWRRASGELVAWIDDDVIVSPGWAAAIVETLDENADVGGCSGPTIVPAELLKNRDVFFFYGRPGLIGILGKLWNSFFLEGKMFEPGLIFKSGAWSPGSNFSESLKIERLKEVDYLEACNMTLRKDLVERVGGFDLGFQGTAEWCEIDLAQKIKKLGYKLVFGSRARVEHRPSRTGVFSQRTFAQERMENFLRFYFRHVFRLRPDYVFKFLAYLLFLNLYWLYKAVKTKDARWLAGFVGTITGSRFLFINLNLWQKYWRMTILLRLPLIRSALVNWPTFLADCFGLVKPKLTTYVSRGGLRYFVRSGTIDLGILDEIVIKKIYTPRDLSLVEVGVVIDVGAQIGIFSVFVSPLVKQGTVFALEPERANFALLLKNLRLNRLDNVIPLNLALAGRAGQRSLFVSPVHPGAHSFYFKSLADHRETVKTTTLAFFLKEQKIDQVDLFKLDAEGAEYEILFNSGRETLAKIKNIVLEYHHLDEKRNGQTLQLFLEKQGFCCRRQSFPEHLIYARRK